MRKIEKYLSKVLLITIILSFGFMGYSKKSKSPARIEIDKEFELKRWTQKPNDKKKSRKTYYCV